jgi:hypothetical protein
LSVTVKVLVPPLQLQATQTTQYTATSIRAIIDKATVTNTDTVSRTFSVNLVTSGGSAGSANLVIDNRTVQPDETYTCPELVGHALEPGGFISTIASAASALTFRVSGREIS